MKSVKCQCGNCFKQHGWLGEDDLMCFSCRVLRDSIGAFIGATQSNRQLSWKSREHWIKKLQNALNDDLPFADLDSIKDS